ncbi:MAG: hypothetical protein AMXMBFR81_17980 [Chthonomonas sp.]
MPTYVYECKACEKVFEVEQRITADPLKDCDCGAEGQLRRLIQPVGIQFVGSGFHINDYKGSSGSAPQAPKAEAGACGTDSCACKTADAV